MEAGDSQLSGTLADHLYNGASEGLVRMSDGTLVRARFETEAADRLAIGSPVSLRLKRGRGVVVI